METDKVSSGEYRKPPFMGVQCPRETQEQELTGLGWGTKILGLRGREEKPRKRQGLFIFFQRVHWDWEDWEDTGNKDKHKMIKFCCFIWTKDPISEPSVFWFSGALCRSGPSYLYE